MHTHIHRAMIQEIIRLLDEAYDHYFATSDGHCKSSEGHVSIRLGTYFDRRDEEQPPVSVGIWSYVFGPGRQKDFNSIEEALSAVREWHAAEMDDDHSEEW